MLQVRFWYIFYTLHEGQMSRLFEFDTAKSAANLAKYAIDFIAAQRLWEDEELIEVFSRADDEFRNIAIGVLENNHWTAVITYRGEYIRIISVRRSRLREVALYESQRSGKGF